MCFRGVTVYVSEPRFMMSWEGVWSMSKDRQMRMESRDWRIIRLVIAS